MPTADNAGVNADAHSTETDQNAQAHSDSENDKFNARHAFDKANEKMNKLEKDYLEKIEELESKLLGKKTEDKPDVDTLIDQKLWRKENSDRIAEVEEDFKKYEKRGYALSDALRLAEFDNGKSSERKETKGVKNSTADATVDREIKPQMPESLKLSGWTEEDWAKYGDAKGKVKIIGR